MVGLAENKANSAPIELELELELSLAIVNTRTDLVTSSVLELLIAAKNKRVCYNPWECYGLLGLYEP